MSQNHSTAPSEQTNLAQISVAGGGVDLYKVVGIPLLCVVFLSGLVLMGAISELRIKELKISLQNIDNAQESGRSLGLIARYNMIQTRSAQQVESANDYLNEGELMAIASGEFDDKSLSIDTFRFFEKPALFFLNTLNFLVGGQQIRNSSEDRGNKLLELAYFYERRREFDKAIKIYDAALLHYKKEASKRAYIFLHRGFSLSLNGSRKEALADYDEVLRLVPRTEMAETAEKLRAFVADVVEKIEKVEKMVASVEKGKAFFDLMAYKKAIEIMNDMEAKNLISQKLYFYRGRAYEETGNVASALGDYRKAISYAPNTELAINANRRIFMLGAFYSSDDKLKKESSENAAKMNDAGFIQKSQDVAAVVDVKKVSEVKKDIYTKAAIEFVNEKTDAALPVPKVVEEVKTFSMGSGELASTKPITAEIKKEPIREEVKKNEEIKTEEVKKEIKQNTPQYTPEQLEAFKKQQAELLKQKEEQAKILAEQQEKLRSEAATLKASGDKLFNEKKYPEAQAEYSKGQQLLPGYTNWGALIQKCKDAQKPAVDANTNTNNKKKEVNLATETNQQVRKEALLNQGTVTKVFTQDGNVFVGAMIGENETHITLATVFGNIKIPKDQIAMRLKVDSKVEIK